MKLIYINAFQECYHPCEVLNYKYNPITKKYILYFFDRSENDFCYAHLINHNGKLLIQDLDFQSEEWLPSALFNFALDNLDVAKLPPYIASIKRPKIYGNEKIEKSTPNHGYIFKKKVDYLELESYEDATCFPKYYYFMIDEMEPTFSGFNYLADYVCESEHPLKKNVIARHKIDIPLSDVEKVDDKYYFHFSLTDKISINLKSEVALVQKIMELNKGKRDNMNTVLLTKVVRMMLAEQDRVAAVRDYQNYLTKFYDKWVLENKEKQL